MPTRRAVLATGLAAATAPTAACAVPPTAGGPEPRLATRWVPAPGTLQPAAHAKLFYLDRRAVDGVRAELADGTYRKYRNYVRFLDVARLGLGPADVAELVQVYPPASSPRRAAVLRADVDAVRERLAGRYDRRARRGGVDVFWSGGRTGDDADGESPTGSAPAAGTGSAPAAGTDDPVEWGGRAVAVGVDGDHLVLGAPTPSASARAVVERVAAAGAGDAPRYAAASPDLGPVLAALGGGDDVSAGTYDRVAAADAAPEHARFAGAVATGHRYRFRGATTHSRYVFAFADAAAAEAAAVERWVGAHRGGRLLGDYRSVSVARRGRTAVVDGRVPTGAV